jgi:adenylate kinase
MEHNIDLIKIWLGQGSINMFGMPFAGKDTQGGVLADLLGAELMGGGTILRNSIIPDHVRQIMEAGELIPTEDYLRIVLPFLSNEKFSGKPLLLSSVGKWQGEEQGVLQATETSGHPIKAVILLTVSEEVARKRHAAGGSADRGVRADDAAEVFETRLAEFRTKTTPVVDFYREKGLLVEVDGSQTPVEVTDEILKKLQQLAETPTP